MNRATGEERAVNARVGALWVGIVTAIFGVLGLAYPDRVMGMLGLAAGSEVSRSAVLGEIRAVYGGLFLVLGLWNIYAAWKAAEAKLLLALLGSVWLGLASGRLLGASVEGNPGVASWAFFVVELLCGLVLLLAAFLPAREETWPESGSPAEALSTPSGGQGPLAP
jgi:DMSO reductase anchor subunit